MAKLYRRIGIRRDNNFSDIDDPKKALNNLLDKLVDTGGTFISEDLDVIRGLFATGLSAGEYRAFAGSTVRETNIDGTTRAADPAITYQNRLDKFKVNSGKSPRLNGGEGLTANYFNQDQVKFTTEPNVFVGVTTGPAIPSDTFWEAGNFTYTRKINQQSINAAGGAQWDGFFVPAQTGQYSFSISSTLGFTGEFEKEGYTTGISTFNSFAKVGLSTVINNTNANVSSVVTNATNEQVTITGTGAVAMAPGIGIGMTVIASTPARVVLGSTVSGVSTTATGTTLITFENEDTDPVVSSGAVDLTLGRPAGVSVNRSITTYTLEKFRPYRVRFRFFVPENVDPASLEKSIAFTYVPPGAIGGTFLRYNNLYPLDYNFSNEVKGSFNTFLDQSILFGGNKDDGTETIGSTTNSTGYVRVSTNKKVDIKYTPKTALTQIERATVTTSWTAGSKVISISDTTGIEIGNYVFSATQGLTADVNTPVRVTDITINEFIIIDAPATNTRTSTALTFVDHRGFVKRVTASSSSGNISISNADTTPRTFGLKSNQIAIWNGSNSYSGITTTGAINNVTVFPSQGFGTQRVYFYESKGLIDKALATFCVPAETQCFIVSSAVTAPNQVLPVSTSTANIQVGYRIQGFPFAAGTTVQSKTANSITLDTPIVKNIAADSNFTATSSSDDKSLCCPPTDTSPPFEPTESGLETTVAQPNVGISSGNLIFSDLVATIPSGNITTITPGAAMPSANTLEIKGGDGVTYNLFCV